MCPRVEGSCLLYLGVLVKYPTVTKAKGYCCEWCDGPYNVWKKKAQRRIKRADKQNCLKEIKKQTTEQVD